MRRGWYNQLIGALFAGDTAGVPKNKLSIVTYNYDRSVDFVIHQFVQQRYGLDTREAWQYVTETVPIVHVHGTLGIYPDIPYGDRSQNSTIVDAIKIISEVEDDARVCTGDRAPTKRQSHHRRLDLQPRTSKGSGSLPLTRFVSEKYGLSAALKSERNWLNGSRNGASIKVILHIAMMREGHLTAKTCSRYEPELQCSHVTPPNPCGICTPEPSRPNSIGHVYSPNTRPHYNTIHLNPASRSHE
ncbi:MAG: hypothetical protein R3C03_00040 [Pirellulaceae bacterium]